MLTYSYSTIDPLGSIGSHAYDINALAQIVGYYRDSSDQVHGFLYRGGSYTTIDDALATNTYALSINASGQIAGWYEDGSSR